MSMITSGRVELKRALSSSIKYVVLEKRGSEILARYTTLPAKNRTKPVTRGEGDKNPNFNGIYFMDEAFHSRPINLLFQQ